MCRDRRNGRREVLMNLAHMPLRIAIGAFFLNSGLEKRTLEETGAASYHGMAAAAMPPLKRVPATTFAKALAATEIAIGTALFVPVIPSALVGAALVGF